MYCVTVDKEIVYATSDFNRFVREIGKRFARIANARLSLADGTPIKLS